MVWPAEGSNRQFQMVADKEIAVTTKKAMEKSLGAGRRCPRSAIAPARALAPVQTPTESMSCWKVV